jgi:hypothetical protein
LFRQLAGWPFGPGGQSDGRLGEFMDGAGVVGAGGAVGEIICAEAALPEIASASTKLASRVRGARMRIFMDISSRPNHSNGWRRRESLVKNGRPWGLKQPYAALRMRVVLAVMLEQNRPES